MENRLANSAAKLVVQMESVIPGLINLGSVLNLPPALAGMVTAEKEALHLSHRNFLEARVRLREKRDDLELALTNGRRFATILRDLRKHELGSKGSREWEALGFRGTRQVPLTTDGVSGLLGTMAGHLESHPELAVPGLDITAAEGKRLKEALSQAVAAVNVAKADVQRALQARAVLLAKSRRLVRKVFNDLMFVLDPLDGRWSEFGFNQPGLKTTPAAPENVTVKVIEENNAMLVQWPAVPLAENYRVWMRVVGVDAEAKPVRRTSDLSMVLEDVLSDADLEIGVTALNRRGEGVMSRLVVVKRVGDVLAAKEATGADGLPIS